MTFKEVQELIKLINRSNLTEFKMRDGEFEISIRTEKYQKVKPVAAPTVVTPAQQIVPVQPSQVPVPSAESVSPPPAAKAPDKSTEPEASTGENTAGYLELRSPMVGTFYRSPSPEKGPYVKVGDVIEKGATVCIIEAMKLFNEIESELAGKIVKVMVEDAQPVEYDQVLFLVDPKG